MDTSESFREPTSWERQLFECMLEVSFPGRDEIAEQLRTCLVRPLDEDGCLEFYLRSDVKAAVVQRIPIEAEADCEGGNVIHALLHVVEGKVNELEFYTNTNESVKRMPNPSEWRLVLLPPPEL